MKVIITFVAWFAMFFGFNDFLKPPNHRLDTIVFLGFEECQFQMNYRVDSTFSEADFDLVMAAAGSWILASEKKLCFSLHTSNVRWHESLTFLYDDQATIYNAQGGIWQQIGLYLDPHCQRKRCVGQAYRTRDMFLSDYSLYRIAVHEFGHTLGLDHSPNVEDIMYPSIGATKISKEDRRVLQCVLKHKNPMLWLNPDCPYKKVSN